MCVREKTKKWGGGGREEESLAHSKFIYCNRYFYGGEGKMSFKHILIFLNNKVILFPEIFNYVAVYFPIGSINHVSTVER